ncbi:MAG: DUF362 domain-containing protein [Limnochordia bacterium]|jgi:uncharacterized protein (DUF362 family)
MQCRTACETAEERRADGEKARIALVKTADRKEGVYRCLELLDNTVAGQDVLIKPNFNTSDPAPGSTHNDTLRALIEGLRNQGAKKITVGERSGPPLTADVLKAKGIPELLEELDVDLINFDELPPEEWVHVNPPGSHWKNGFIVPRIVTEAPRIVATGCLKTHQFGGIFTLSLKLAVGLVPRRGYEYMRELHDSPHIRKMIAEINYAYHPCLIVMDGVDAFVSGGPSTGERRQANVIWAGHDRIAVDAVGVAILKDLGTTPEIENQPIFAQEQIQRAGELGLGVTSPDSIEIVTADKESEDYAAVLRGILAKG